MLFSAATKKKKRNTFRFLGLEELPDPPAALYIIATLTNLKNPGGYALALAKWNASRGNELVRYTEKGKQ